MKTIFVRWLESTDYAQKFEVEDDFDLENEDLLEELIVEQGDFTHAFDGITERQIESTEVVE